MAAKDEDRKMSLITKVRNLENELHNREVLSNATGSLAVVYHEQKTLHGAYIPCQYWHGHFGRGQLWRHVKKWCKCRPAHSKSTMRPVPAICYCHAHQILE